jgi:hypothetical protein
MKTVISKELLIEVLHEKVSIDKNTNIEIFESEFNGTCIRISNGLKIFTINIYELQHKCKEWADKLGYDISSSLNECVLIHREGTGVVCKFHGVNSTFLACQWILNNKEIK